MAILTLGLIPITIEFSKNDIIKYDEKTNCLVVNNKVINETKDRIGAKVVDAEGKDISKYITNSFESFQQIFVPCDGSEKGSAVEQKMFKDFIQDVEDNGNGTVYLVSGTVVKNTASKITMKTTVYENPADQPK